MKKGVVVFVLALLPVAASAQVIRPFPGQPTASGISVQGRGSIRYTSRNLQIVAQARGDADEQDVIGAMRRAGVDDVVIGPSGAMLYPSALVSVRGVVRDATRAKLESIGKAAVQYVAAHPGLTIQDVAFGPTADACAPHEQEARAAAIADARRRAASIAALSGLALEAIVAVSEAGGCPFTGDAIAPQVLGGSAFDLATLTATVTVSESVTFAVSAASGGQRRTL